MPTNADNFVACAASAIFLLSQYERSIVATDAQQRATARQLRDRIKQWLAEYEGVFTTTVEVAPRSIARSPLRRCSALSAELIVERRHCVLAALARMYAFSESSEERELLKTVEILLLDSERGLLQHDEQALPIGSTRRALAASPHRVVASP